MKQKLINELLAAQTAIARAVNVGQQSGGHGLLEERDAADLRAMLIVIPAIAGRVEK